MNHSEQHIIYLISQLNSQRKQAVLILRFLHEWTQGEVASALKISQPAVSQLEKSALEKLRKTMHTNKIKGAR